MPCADRPHGLLGLAVAATVASAALVATPRSEALPPPRPAGPHTLAALPGATALALDAGHVYAIAGGAIVRVARGGGPVETLATGDARELAVTSHYVWWTSARGVERLAKRTGERTLLTHANAYGGHLAAVGDDVWFVVPRLLESYATYPVLVFAGEAAQPRRVGDVTAITATLTVTGTRSAVVFVSESGLAAFPIAAARSYVVSDQGLPPLALAGDQLLADDTDGVTRYALAPDPDGPPRATGGNLLGDGWLRGHGQRATAAEIAARMGPMTEAAAASAMPTGTALDAVASDGAAIAIATSDGLYEPMFEHNCWCAPAVIGRPHTGVISRVGARGLEPVVTGEEPIARLAIDGHGLVWLAGETLRATSW